MKEPNLTGGGINPVGGTYLGLALLAFAVVLSIGCPPPPPAHGPVPTLAGSPTLAPGPIPTPEPSEGPVGPNPSPSKWPCQSLQPDCKPPSPLPSKAPR